MKKEKLEPDFKQLADGIVLAEEKEQKLSEMNDQIQTLTRLCERMEEDIEKYSRIEQNISEGFLKIQSSVSDMGIIRDNIRQFLNDNISTTLDLRLNDVDGTLTRFEKGIKRNLEEGAKECRRVVDDAVCNLRSLLIGKTNDMETVLISAKTRRWIVWSSIFMVLTVWGLIVLCIHFSYGR